MANMELITSVTVGAGGAASVTLPATGTIPQTYTDLKLVWSVRTTYTNNVDTLLIRFNSSTSGYQSLQMIGFGSGSGYSEADPNGIAIVSYTGNGSTTTANTFSNAELYIPNYTSTNSKSISTDGVWENNATAGWDAITAGYWSGTSPITNISIVSNNSANFVEGSTFYLYGISKVTSTPNAIGGIVSQDANYWYHMFPFSSTFTPIQSLSADILVVAGGGGGGANQGGGGGAGGLLGFTSQSLTTTSYTVTVGAGGALTTDQSQRASSGGNSQFGALTAAVGGGGAGSLGLNTGVSGGSGGGGATNWYGYAGAGNSAGGTGTSGQGNAGGSGYSGGSNIDTPGGGGGGATSAGASATSSVAGVGGAGSSAYSSWGIATFTGQVIGSTAYFAGGGGGGTRASTGQTASAGGFGGGASGTNGSTLPINALANTGGGGGGGGNGTAGAIGSNGGSGVVIVRYAK